MGTSKSYDSPKWPGVNKQVGKAVSKGSPTKSAISNAVGAFAAAYKGVINTGTTGRSGKTTGGTSITGRTTGGRGGGAGATSRVRSAGAGARLGSFLSGVASSGLGPTLESFGLGDFVGKPLQDILDAILDRLCENGGLLDDAALTEAMARTLDELSADAETVEEFDKLLSESTDDLEGHLQSFFANVLAVNFEQKEGGFVRNKIPQSQCDHFFKESRDLIRTLVSEELAKERDLSTIDWKGHEAFSIADQINQEVLNILIGDE